MAATASSTMNTLPPPSQEARPTCACESGIGRRSVFRAAQPTVMTQVLRAAQPTPGKAESQGSALRRARDAGAQLRLAALEQRLGHSVTSASSARIEAAANAPT